MQKAWVRIVHICSCWILIEGSILIRKTRAVMNKYDCHVLCLKCMTYPVMKKAQHVQVEKESNRLEAFDHFSTAQVS